MPTLNYPSGLYVPQAGHFKLVSNTRTFTSPLSGVTQTLETPGARWSGEVVYNSLTAAEVATLRSFEVKLRGQSGRFYYGDPFSRTPAGVATGTPLVNGASQTGTSLITDGWTASQTNILKAGEYIQLATDELKMVVEDVNSDGSGNATLTIEPPLRSSPADGSAITVQDAKGIMRLDADDFRWTYSRTARSMSLSFVEAFT